MGGDPAQWAIENNALAGGWDIGVHAAGSIMPGRAGFRFEPMELETVVWCARQLAAIAPAWGEDEPEGKEPTP